MIDVRCKGWLKNGQPCTRMLGKFNYIDGAIKCPKCGMIFEYKVSSTNSLRLQSSYGISEVGP